MKIENVEPCNLSANDFYILCDPFVERVAELFPIPISVRFFSIEPERGNFPLSDIADFVPPLIFGKCSQGEVCSQEDQLFIPFELTNDRKVVVNLYDAEPQLLAKMDIEWLLDFQASLYGQLSAVRLLYSDPETDQYNSRAGDLFFHGYGLSKDWNFLLIHVVSKSRSVLAQRQKLKHTASFLQATTGDALFHFGGGVFGLLSSHTSRNKTLYYAHSVQRRLKREGMRKVQIGFCRNDASKHSPDLSQRSFVELTWEALAIAERRGPFGISDTAVVLDKNNQPFTLPKSDILKKVRRQWVGLSRFGLAVCVLEGEGQWPEFTDTLYSDFTVGKTLHVDTVDNVAFVFFPDCSADSLKQEVKGWVAILNNRFGEKAVSIGVGYWPCLSYSKTDTLRNARKALLHGSFYGAGEVVFFDHLSLNVSGDFLFDEGDHRAAARDFRNGLLLRPDDVNLLNSLGVTLIELNQPGRAVSCFKSVLELDPGNYMALVNLGLVWQTGNKKPEALAFFEKARAHKLASAEPYPELYQPLGRLYCELGFFQKAVEILNEHLTLQGGDNEYTLYKQLARAYYGNGQAEDAIVACQRTLQLFPHDAYCLSLLGLLYAETGQGEDVGLALCRKALAIEEVNPDHWHRIGTLLLMTGDMAAAFEAARHCLKLSYQHVDGLLLLARLYEDSEKTKAAVRLYFRVLNKSDVSSAHKRIAKQQLERLGIKDESV